MTDKRSNGKINKDFHEIMKNILKEDKKIKLLPQHTAENKEMAKVDVIIDDFVLLTMLANGRSFISTIYPNMPACTVMLDTESLKKLREILHNILL